MFEFFRGWKRKCGVVVLCLACISTIVWLRGTKYGDDTIQWPIDDSSRYVVGIPPAGYWFTKQRTKTFRFKNGGSTSINEYEWIYVIPYWYVSTPLMLLSAWLLFSKSGKHVRSHASDRKLKDV